jgi:hypothetical protein
MKLKKSDLEVIFNFTKGTEGVLNLADSRFRDTFLKMLSDKTQAFYDERNKIYEAFCVKKDGKPDLKDGDKYQFEKADLPKLNEELLVLANEEAVITLPDNLPTTKLKEILEKSEYKPKALEAEVIDLFLNSI